jgi:hypothetical protein
MRRITQNREWAIVLAVLVVVFAVGLVVVGFTSGLLFAIAISAATAVAVFSGIRRNG